MGHAVGRKTNTFLFTFTCRSNPYEAYKKTLRFDGALKFRYVLKTNSAILRISTLYQPFELSHNFLVKAYLHRSGMTSNSFASHNRACFCKAWVGKYSPCKWYTAYTPCVLGATHASYRLIRSVCLFGKCSCYGNLDIQCTASRNPRFTQWSLS